MICAGVPVCVGMRVSVDQCVALTCVCVCCMCLYVYLCMCLYVCLCVCLCAHKLYIKLHQVEIQEREAKMPSGALH